MTITMAESRAVKVALMGVEDGPEGPTWSPGCLQRFERVLEIEMMRPEAGATLQEVLRLLAALRKQSSSMADQLAGIVKRVPGVQERVSAKPGESIDHVRRFTASEGRRVALRAPSTREPRPEGAVPLKRLVDPSGTDRARANSRARKEAKHGCQ